MAVHRFHMFSQFPPVVREFEVQQTGALVLGSLRRVLTLFRFPQTRLRLFVHFAETPRGFTLFLKIVSLPPFL